MSGASASVGSGPDAVAGSAILRCPPERSASDCVRIPGTPKKATPTAEYHMTPSKGQPVMEPDTMPAEAAAPSRPPSCTNCTRPAEPHYAVGYYKACKDCRVTRARARQRLKARGRIWWEKCSGCGGTLRSSTTCFCSTACSTGYKRQVRQRYKAEVLNALGGACGCVGITCWHRGPCGISDPELLEVDHVHNNGAAIRRATRGGTWKPNSQKVNSWSRYRRALQLTDHGMQLLCSNCHRKVTFERRSDSLVA
jgi:hypothetical protein